MGEAAGRGGKMARQSVAALLKLTTRGASVARGTCPGLQYEGFDRWGDSVYSVVDDVIDHMLASNQVMPLSKSHAR